MVLLYIIIIFLISKTRCTCLRSGSSAPRCSWKRDRRLPDGACPSDAWVSRLSKRALHWEAWLGHDCLVQPAGLHRSWIIDLIFWHSNTLLWLISVHDHVRFCVHLFSDSPPSFIFLPNSCLDRFPLILQLDLLDHYPSQVRSREESLNYCRVSSQDFRQRNEAKASCAAQRPTNVLPIIVAQRSKWLYGSPPCFI